MMPILLHLNVKQLKIRSQCYVNENIDEIVQNCFEIACICTLQKSLKNLQDSHVVLHHFTGLSVTAEKCMQPSQHHRRQEKSSVEFYFIVSLNRLHSASYGSRGSVVG
jgi:hypothetical protein